MSWRWVGAMAVRLIPFRGPGRRPAARARAVVPRPGSLASAQRAVRAAPPGPWIIDRPRPGALAQLLGGEERLGRLLASVSASMPMPVSVTDQAQIGAGRQVRPVAPRLRSRRDRQPAAVGHRVARIDGQIEQRELDLVGDRPAPSGRFSGSSIVSSICGPDRALEQIGHAAHQLGQARWARPAGPGGARRRAAAGSAPRRARPPCNAPSISRGWSRRRRGSCLRRSVEIAEHRHQQIVEIVRDAAGELADHLHLLRLAQIAPRRAPAGGFPPAPPAWARCRLRGAHATRCSSVSLSCRNSSSAVLRSVMSDETPISLRTRLLVADQARPDFRPMHAAVGPDGAVLDRVVGSRLDAGSHRRLHAVAVVGMNVRDQVLVGERLVRLAAEHRLAGSGSGEIAVRQVQFPGCPDGRPSARCASRSWLSCSCSMRARASILPLAPFDRGARDADEGGRMERPLQEGDIAEQFGQARGGGVALDAAAALRQDDEGQVRPGWLVADPCARAGEGPPSAGPPR